VGKPLVPHALVRLQCFWIRVTWFIGFHARNVVILMKPFSTAHASFCPVLRPFTLSRHIGKAWSKTSVTLDVSLDVSADKSLAEVANTGRVANMESYEHGESWMQLYRKSSKLPFPLREYKQTKSETGEDNFFHHWNALLCLGRELSLAVTVARLLQDTCLLGFIFQIAILIKRLISVPITSDLATPEPQCCQEWNGHELILVSLPNFQETH